MIRTGDTLVNETTGETIHFVKALAKAHSQVEADFPVAVDQGFFIGHRGGALIEQFADGLMNQLNAATLGLPHGTFTFDSHRRTLPQGK